MKNQQRWTQFWRPLVVATVMISGASQAATITVNSLLDDVFPDATGALFDVTGAPVTLAASKCTLRMAIASANLDVAVGGATFGCVAGDSESNVSVPNGYPDVIVFSSGLTGTINVNVSKLMSEAPAVYRDVTGAVSPNTTSALVVSRPLTINGNFVGTTLAPGITLDGGLLANPAVNGRLMIVSDGDNNLDMRVSLFALAFANGRRVNNAGGCLFSRDSLTISYASFTNCVSDGDATGAGYGGALGMYTSRNTSVSSNPVPQARPSLTLNTVSFTNNKGLRGSATTGASGAGALALGSSVGYVGHIVMNGVTVSGNQADNYGGGVIRNAQSVTINNSEFSSNQATGTRDSVNTLLNSGFGGGLLIRTGNVVSLGNTRFTNNSAGQGQGGLDVVLATEFNANDLTITGNSAASTVAGTSVRDAGLRISSATNVTGSRWNVSNNTLTGDPTVGGSTAGANILSATGKVLLRDIVISGNTCTDVTPCGLNVSGNNIVDIERIKIGNNVSNKTGSAYVGQVAFGTSQNVSFRMSGAEISGNTIADGVILRAGASYNDYNTTSLVAVNPLPPTTNTFLIENSVIHGNTTATSFVTYLETPGIYTFRNVTIANNQVGSGSNGCGGGISVQAYQLFSGANPIQLLVQNSTIARNRVAQCQAAIGFGSYSPSGPVPVAGTLRVESSILGREAAGGNKDVIFGNDPSKITLVNTLVEDNAGPLSAQCTTNGNLCNTNPLLDAVALNGGPTPTMRLLPGSPALNVGSNPANLTTDQRGAARVVGAAADMGAFESPPIVAGNCNLDMDGDSLLNGNKEGLVLLRAMLGFTGPATTVGTGISAAQWNTARPLINANCGTSFP